MKDGIEGLIESTIAHIKTALDNSKPGEAKVYTEMLVLLRQIPPRRSPNVDMNKTFEKIPERNNPNV